MARIVIDTTNEKFGSVVTIADAVKEAITNYRTYLKG